MAVQEQRQLAAVEREGIVGALYQRRRGRELREFGAAARSFATVSGLTLDLSAAFSAPKKRFAARSRTGPVKALVDLFEATHQRLDARDGGEILWRQIGVGDGDVERGFDLEHESHGGDRTQARFAEFGGKRVALDASEPRRSGLDQFEQARGKRSHARLVRSMPQKVARCCPFSQSSPLPQLFG